MSETRRRQARELVLKALYAHEIGQLNSSEAEENLIDSDELESESKQFAKELFQAVIKHQNWADSIISNFSNNWKIERIARIDRSILQIAIVELRECPDTPIKVVLNEAIELAKKYSTMESSGFINGILDSFIKSKPDFITS